MTGLFEAVFGFFAAVAKLVLRALTALVDFVRKYPGWASAIAIVLVGAPYHFAALHREHVLSDAEGFARGTAQYQLQIDEDHRLQNIANDLAQRALDKLAAESAKAQRDAAENLAKARAENARLRARIKQVEDAYVGSLRVGPRADVPLGYLLWRGAAAAYANGSEFAAAPESAGEPLNGPSGVSFGALADADLEQAGAFRSLRDWGRGWQAYAFQVKQQCEHELAIVQGKEP